MTDRADNVVNLNRFRKAKSRTGKETTASANRALHGRTKAEKAREELERSHEKTTLDDHKLDDPGAPDDKDPA